MDRAIALIVRVISAFSGWAYVLPGVDFARYQPDRKLKVLLAGYNGARNTGSDVRVAALADQIIAALGRGNVEVSVMSLDCESTAPYFEGKADQVPFTTLFFGALLKACSEHHVIVLCEGSTFKSKFADALTLYSCEAAGIARAQGKPCVAYGGEVGEMTPFLELTVRDLCRETLFIARSGESFDAARRLGLNARKGTDTAWTFDSARGRETAMELLRSGGWDGVRPLLGIAPVNPYWWPVQPSIVKWLCKTLCNVPFLQFQKWYFFSWSVERDALYQAYLDDLAAACATFAGEQGFQPVVFGMEQLDEDACAQLAERLFTRFGMQAPVVLSRDYDGYVIGEALRSLSLLVTSRYHAQVLAMGADVPAVAVSMDERLDNLAQEFDLPSSLLLHVDDADLAERVLLGLDYAWDRKSELAASISAGRAVMESRLADMAEWFADAVRQRAAACNADDASDRPFATEMWD